MRLKNLDLIAIGTIAAINVLWALLPARIPAIGVILALPLIFVLPGYTLTEALFHKGSFSASYRLVLTLALSLAVDILSGILLNVLPVGLQAKSWAVFLGTLVVVLCLLVMFLRRGRQTHQVQARSLKFRFNIYACIFGGLALSITILSVLYSITGVVGQRYPGFTQLWVDSAAQNGESCAVHIGIRSFESTSVPFRITMTTNGTQVTTWSSITLAPQEEWNRLVPVTSGNIAQYVYVDVQLYRLDKAKTVYREVNVTFPTSRAGKDGKLQQCLTQPITPQTYPVLASAYHGTLHDIRANLTTNLSLSSIQQMKGSLNGYFTASSGLPGSGAFRGIVTTDQSIQFTISRPGRANLAFNGSVQSDGYITGTYCSLNLQGQCSGESYGIWSITPTSP